MTDNTVRKDEESGHDVVVLSQLERICSSPEFQNSPKLQQFLTYLIDEFLAGRSEQIKGFTIAQDVFGRSDLDDANTSTIVSVEARRLRRKLGDYYAKFGLDDPIVISVPKGGYVPKIGAQEAPPKAKQVLPEGANADSPEPELHRNGKWPWRSVALALVATVTLLVGWGFYIDDQKTPVRSGFPAKPTIAVLPFSNHTGSVENNTVAGDLAQGIIIGLSVLSEIDVIAYSSVRLSSNPSMRPEEIGNIFDATHALRGTIESNGNSMRVNAELFETSTGKLAWADRFDFTVMEKIALSDEISDNVVRQMLVRLSDSFPPTNSAAQNGSPEAVTLFKQAMEITNSPRNPDRLRLAEQTFQLAISADPDYVGGYAGLAYIKSFTALFGHSDNPRAVASEALEFASKALEMDENSALALDAAAFSHMILRDFPAALEASLQAVTVAPNDPYAHSYHAIVLCASGEPQAAIPYAKRAIRLDPLEPRTPYLNILGVVQFFAGDYEAALSSFLANDARQGPDSNGHRAFIAATYAALGDLDEAASIASSLPEGFVENGWTLWFDSTFQSSDGFEIALQLVRDTGVSR